MGIAAALAQTAGPDDHPELASWGRYCAGLLAFGLEQTGDWAGAERVARRALPVAEDADSETAALRAAVSGCER